MSNFWPAGHIPTYQQVIFLARKTSSFARKANSSLLAFFFFSHVCLENLADIYELTSSCYPAAVDLSVSGSFFFLSRLLSDHKSPWLALPHTSYSVLRILASTPCSPSASTSPLSDWLIGQAKLSLVSFGIIIVGKLLTTFGRLSAAPFIIPVFVHTPLFGSWTVVVKALEVKKSSKLHSLLPLWHFFLLNFILSNLLLECAVIQCMFYTGVLYLILN